MAKLSDLVLLALRFPYSARRAKKADFSALIQETQRMGYQPSANDKVNFSHGDEVDTEYIFNADFAECETPYNYLIELESGTNNIISYWYIVEMQRTTLATACQYRLILRRDVATEYFEKYKSRAFYAEKGWINDPFSPLLFQPEGISADKVKTAEYPISDETRCKWIVGYLAPNMKERKTVMVEATESKSPSAVMSFSNREAFFSYIGGTNTAGSQLAFNGYLIGIQYLISRPSWVGGKGVLVYPSFGYSMNPTPKGDFTSFSHNFSTTEQAELRELQRELAENYLGNLEVTAEELWTFLRSAADNIPNGFISKNGYKKLKSLEGKIIYIESEKQNYQVNYSSSKFENYKNLYYAKTSAELFGIVQKAVPNTADSAKMGDDSVVFSYSADLVEVSLKESPYNTITLDIRSSSECPTAENGPYKIFCLPLVDGNINVGDSVSPLNSKVISVTKDMAIRIASAIATQLGEFVYDIQILPYCPAREIITSITYTNPTTKFKREYEAFACGRGICDFAKDGTGKDVLPVIYTANDSATFYRQAETSYYIGYNTSTNPISFSYRKDESLKIKELSYSGGLDSKVKDITELWRLVSPNWQGSAFEFSPQRNGGVDSFRVDFTYRPNSPFIIVRPKFSGLYGDDFGDDRGLVCGGDFSMPRTSSEWASYQLRNINYENIFSRQYHTMDLQASEQRLNQIMGVIGGIAQGTSKGITAGMAAGGPVGAIIGGIVGMGSAIGGGVADYNISENLRKDQLGSARDLHRMSLENIQARPESLTRGGYQITINRDFPTLEYYKAPEEEEKAIRNNINYGSMTIGSDMPISDLIATEKPSGYTLIRGQFDSPVAGLPNSIQMALRDEFSAGIYLPSTLIS